MADGTADPGEHIERVGLKVDAAFIRIDRLAASMDQRFDEVSAALGEQRQYTEFAFDHLRGEMRTGFEEVRGRFDGLEGRFDGLEGRFDGLEGRFDGLEGRFDGLEGRFDGLEGRLARVERKLDQFIDVQSAANLLVERRLNALERKK